MSWFNDEWMNLLEKLLNQMLLQRRKKEKSFIFFDDTGSEWENSCVHNLVGCNPNDEEIDDEWQTNFESELKELSGISESIYEQCIQLLSAGFTPSGCAFLAKKLKDVLAYTLSPLINQYKIEVPLSRTLICIADPTGTL